MSEAVHPTLARAVALASVGCKSFDAAQDTLVGIELMHMMKERQLVVEVGAGGLAKAKSFIPWPRNLSTDKGNFPFMTS
jgi:hypothetical protein